MIAINRYEYKNSIIHNCNPLIKFLIFLSIIFLLFLKGSFLIQLSLMGLTLLVSYLSKIEKPVYKRFFKFYVGLFLFTLVIKWFFDKSPGFWNPKHVQDSYSEIFSWLNPSSAEDKIQNGWFSSGTLVISSGKSETATGNSADCIRKIANVSTATCFDSSIQSNTTSSQGLSLSDLKIFKVKNASGSWVYVGFFSKWHTITLKHFLYAWEVANKLIVIIMLTVLLSMTTSTSDIAYALEDILQPLKLFKLPANEIAFILAIALRFSPSLLQDSFRIVKAQASRGIDFKNGKFKDKIMSILALFIPLFFISFMKANELSSALVARGYKPYECRSTYKMHKTNFTDYFYFSIVITFLSFLYSCVLRSKPAYSNLFGNIDYLSLIGNN